MKLHFSHPLNFCSDCAFSRSFLFTDQIPIKFDSCHGHIRGDPEVTDEEGQDSQKHDSNKAQIQVEVTPAVAFHQGFALCHYLFGGEVGIVQVDQVDLGVVQGYLEGQCEADQEQQDKDNLEYKGFRLKDQQCHTDRHGNHTAQGQKKDPKGEQDHMIWHGLKYKEQIRKLILSAAGHIQHQVRISCVQEGGKDADD